MKNQKTYNIFTKIELTLFNFIFGAVFQAVFIVCMLYYGDVLNWNENFITFSSLLYVNLIFIIGIVINFLIYKVCSKYIHNKISMIYLCLIAFFIGEYLPLLILFLFF